MINHTYKVIFIHTRKTAGTSIIDTFGMKPKNKLVLSWKPKRNPDYTAYDNGLMDPKFADARERYKDYFVFSTVRNPFDRIVSGWKYLPDQRDRPLIDVLRDPPQDLFGLWHFTMPQHKPLYDEPAGRLVTDDLIRFESLQDDFDRISDRIGKPRKVLPHIKASKRERDYRSYFDAETRRLAEERFGRDLELFGYEF